jgi:hypothetical protein
MFPDPPCPRDKEAFAVSHPANQFDNSHAKPLSMKRGGSFIADPPEGER